MFCSTIIPTVGRPSLAQAVQSVLDQDFAAAEFEVIVVNDSGQPLPEETWQDAPNVRVLTTYCHERCVARNTGAAMARGKYLHFLDDDDVLLPGAMEAFWDLDRQSDDVVWLYGSYQTVDNSGTLVATWQPGIVGDIFPLVIAGESIPFQASLLLSAAFFQAGMFDPHPSIVGVEDRDVGRRLAFLGDVAYSPALVAAIRIGEQGSTTNWAAIAERDRWGREKALRLADASTQLHRSTPSAYLSGRISRAYFASAAWNLRHRNGFTAMSRTITGLSFIGIHVLSQEFWNGLKTNLSRK